MFNYMDYCIYSKRSIKLWVFENSQKMLPITEKENKIADEINSIKSDRYRFSRGYTRNVLGKLFSINPLDVPLCAKPREAPILEDGFGFLSLSHTKDALAISWSTDRVGIDIERLDRNLRSAYLLRKYLNSEKHFDLNDDEEIRKKILSIWVIKEALIKRERSSIAEGFKNWDINSNFTLAKNNSNNDEVFLKKFSFKSWLIGLACNQI